MADKIVVMRDGEIEQVGAPLELYDRPSNIFVAGFIGSPAMNLIEGRLQAGRFVGPDGLSWPAAGFAAIGDRDVILGVRPEHIQIDKQGVPVDVEVVEQTGSEMLLSTRSGKTVVNCLLRERIAVEAGARIGLGPRVGALHFFDPATGVSLAGI